MREKDGKIGTSRFRSIVKQKFTSCKTSDPPYFPYANAFSLLVYKGEDHAEENLDGSGSVIVGCCGAYGDGAGQERCARS
jgi:hypothetical protein